MPGHAKYQMTSKDMKIWIKDGEMDPDYPLHPYVDRIVSTSPKLEFVGEVLDIRDEKENGKLVIHSEFVVVAFMVSQVCLLLRPFT